MSTIIADNLTGKTSAGSVTVTSEGGAATQSLQQGLAKAWVNLNGTGTIAVRDSLNIASLTDIGTGGYDTNFTNNFSAADYSYLLSADGVVNGNVTSLGYGDSDNAPLTTGDATVESRGGVGGGSNVDATVYTTAGFGDLA